MANKNPDVQEVTKLINTLKKDKIFLRKTEGVSKIKLFVEAEGDRDSAKEKMDNLLKSKGYPTETTRVSGHSAEASAIKGKILPSSIRIRKVVWQRQLLTLLLQSCFLVLHS